MNGHGIYQESRQICDYLLSPCYNDSFRFHLMLYILGLRPAGTYNGKSVGINAFGNHRTHYHNY